MSVETMEYLGAARRFIRASGPRVAAADEPELARLVELRNDVDAAVTVAIQGWLDMGRSWTDVGKALGITRQAARQRWGQLVTVKADTPTPPS